MLMGGGAVPVAGTCPTIFSLSENQEHLTLVSPLLVALFMHGAVMLKGCARVASRWGVLSCDADGRWCDAGCRDLSYNQLATLPESFGDLRVGGDL